MLVGKLAGRDRVPQHWRQNGLECGKVTHHAAVDERIERRHQASLEQWSDVLPIGRVPADEENLTFSHLLCRAPRIAT